MSAIAMKGGWAKVVIVTCDKCGCEIKAPDSTNRVEVRGQLRTMGWKHHKPDIDLCPECIKEAAE